MCFASSAPLFIILAGGQSRRFGDKDKALQELGGKRLIDRAVQLGQALSLETFIAGPSSYETGVQNWSDREDGPAGPIAALWRFIHNHHNAQSCLTIAVDCPFLTAPIMRTLVEQEITTVAATPSRQHPIIGHWYRKPLKEALPRLLSKRETNKAPSMHALAEACRAKKIHFTDETAFMNINTKEDLQAARERLDNSPTS